MIRSKLNLKYLILFSILYFFQTKLSKVVTIDGKQYLEKMNYQILNNHVLEHRILEGKYIFLLITSNTIESSQYLGLFDTISMELQDQTPSVEFLIINVRQFPESKKFLKIQDLDVPQFRFYCRGNEIPYTEHFWNRYRIQTYIKKRIKNQVITIETPEEMEEALEKENSLVYFHDGSLLPYQNKVMNSLEAMASLYQHLPVYRVINHKLFQLAKDYKELSKHLDIKNKPHFLVFHSPHRGFISQGFPEGFFDFKSMREFYSKNQFAHVLDYSIQVHDFLLIEQSPAIFLVLKEDGVKKLNHLEKGNFFYLLDLFF